MELNRSTVIRICLSVYAALTLILLIVGIVLMSGGGQITQINIKTHSIDYTDCINFEDDEQTCAQYLNEPNNAGSCKCDADFKLEEDFKGNVTVYYELDGYQQTFSSIFDSSDPSQWSGVLSPTPSESCGSYRYANTTEGMKPIVPCGALADAMFNDTYYLYNTKMQIQLDETGLMSDAEKANFKNPLINVRTAVGAFTKPVNWPKTIWDLGQPNSSNIGLMNERFIAWMDTSVRRKPAARVRNVTGFEYGLPQDQYKFKVIYNYPPSRYNGTRRIILEAVQVTHYETSTTSGCALLILGLLLFVLAIAAYVYWKKGKTISLPFWKREANETEDNKKEGASEEAKPLDRPAGDG